MSFNWNCIQITKYIENIEQRWLQNVFVHWFVRLYLNQIRTKWLIDRVFDHWIDCSFEWPIFFPNDETVSDFLITTSLIWKNRKIVNKKKTVLLCANEICMRPAPRQTNTIEIATYRDRENIPTEKLRILLIIGLLFSICMFDKIMGGWYKIIVWHGLWPMVSRFRYRSFKQNAFLIMVRFIWTDKMTYTILYGRTIRTLDMHKSHLTTQPMTMSTLSERSNLLYMKHGMEWKGI